MQRKKTLIAMKKTKPLDISTQANKSTDGVFIRDVFDYYDIHGRHDLPWRSSVTAYRTLVSEVMLQQTQVSRVTPKFLLWMKRYPTLSKLRSATLTDILILWQGLGYQRRAKALYTIAQGNHALPRTYDGLRALSGVGPYTASAICAFAYNEFPPMLIETNIRTALIEAFHVHKNNVQDTILQEDLMRLLQHPLVWKRGAREWYYALMDYGAYLKSRDISHNARSAHVTKQKPYQGSRRQLRARALFAITHNKALPDDIRLPSVLDELLQEEFIVRKGKKYRIA